MTSDTRRRRDSERGKKTFVTTFQRKICVIVEWTEQNEVMSCEGVVMFRDYRDIIMKFENN